MDPQGKQVPIPLRREGDLRKIADLGERVRLLDEAIARVQHTENLLQASEASFRRVTEDCGGLLQAVGTVEQLEALNERLTRLVEDSTRRMEEFEAGVSREWETLRAKYEEPLKAFQEQALAIRQTSAEAGQLVALCRQLAQDSFAALAARNSSGLPVHASESEPWSLDDVTRVHRELRSAQRRDGEHRGAEGVQDIEVGQPPPLEVASREQTEPPRSQLFRWSALGLVVIAGLAILWYTLQMRERVVFLDSRVQEATTRIADAEKQATEARQLAQEQVLEAQRTARYAQVVAEIVAAPDLRRLDLVGRPPAPDAFAQALWSRTRGFHLSASHLPPAPVGKVYKVWAVAQGEASSLGVVRPNPDGRGNLLIDQAPSGLRVNAVIVSLEDDDGAGQPTGTIYLGPRPAIEESRPPLE